ncbi:hypothetical protein [Clostridium cellulovorans]|uniref:SMODS and SLOG-associating 2TM effector domain-containing protein n=1 Tax=Clostridium cellulovorans (strain ATCC 35296 / DSM 3052 / OCM 3 / 743B) TaxID=573061 RepID=D9STH7_CLOC7|nr:hypothetical protein [Clostridium cellulovorans]ADL52711.1 hypothetical protein Clocel_3021 [Clostridium cellulovorans 743B]
MNYKDFKNQTFYIYLKPNIVEKALEILKLKKRFDSIESYKWIGYIVLLLIALTLIKSNDMSKELSIKLTLLVLSGSIMFIIDNISQDIKKELDKKISSFQKQMLIEFCNCNDSCNCRKDFVNYMKGKKINILS